MKIFSCVLKILAALAAIAGVVYVVATYGDKIVALARKLLGMACCECEDCECNENGECLCDCECEDCDCCDCECDACDDECECTCQEGAAAEEAPAEDPVEAVETDFEG